MAAACAAQMGWPVFPLGRYGKKPLTQHGHRDATTDPAVVTDWWRRWPGANIGYAVPAGTLVLDVDGDAGRASLAALEAQHGPLPATPSVRTGGDGQHRYFALPGGTNAACSAGKLASGLDIRTHGGYAVLPPSVHESGRAYEWAIRCEPAPCPPWLLALVIEPERAAQANTSMIPPGRRHDHLLSLAGTLRQKNVAPAAIEAALLAENAARCYPPKPEAEVCELAADICARYNPQAAAAAKGFTLTPLCELLARPDRAEDWLWDGRLACGTVSLVAAKPKVGKSVLARNLALAVARGEDFLGRATKRGEVIYLALEERDEEVKADFRALGATGNEPIFVHADTAPEGGIAALTGLVRQRRPVLVVIDPIVRLARFRDEGAYAEVYAALGPLVDLAREAGSHILLLHHAGKSLKADAIDAPLGSTALGGAPAAIIVLRRTEAYRTIRTVQRRGDDLAETVLSFDPASKRLALGGSRMDADVQTVAAEILRALEAGPKTEEVVLADVGGRTGTLRSALRVLVTDGRVLRTGSGHRGDPFQYQTAAPGQESAQEKSSFARSRYILGTRERETGNGAEPCVNSGEKLVPESEPNPILVPVNCGAGSTPCRWSRWRIFRASRRQNPPRQSHPRRAAFPPGSAILRLRCARRTR